ncbi:hypothetical protein BHE74_00003423 [Ensete ventricosum]|nr:hypothetical protein GW17_00019064 [Ensete ventricosum]RWW87730.1 hypothetical protein BHE74_00003423 [Ensete ventricosum]
MTRRGTCAGSAATPGTPITHFVIPAPAAGASNSSTRIASCSGLATATLASAR